MTTEAFLAYLDEELLQPEQVKIDVDKWVYQAGLPDDLVVPTSDAFAKVEAELARWTSGTPATELDIKGWTTFQWMHFLRHLPDPMTHEQLADLDEAFGFTQAG
ncbi:MAG: aminopeptidase, partial [Flavobacteriales bacterium]|nr:aminopeptidase [Flavobacteriales bacterium]